jgi:hypothetical protein
VNTTTDKPLSTWCAWCATHMRGPKFAPANETSHGICLPCLRNLFGPLVDTDQIIAAALAAEAEAGR